MLLLSARFSVLLLRKDDGLRQQPEREKSAAFIWRMGPVHVCGARKFSGEGAGRFAFRGGGADGDFRGVRGTGPRETDVRVSERVVSFRRHGGGPRRGSFGNVLSDEGADAGRGDDYRSG